MNKILIIFLTSASLIFPIKSIENQPQEIITDSQGKRIFLSYDDQQKLNNLELINTEDQTLLKIENIKTEYKILNIWASWCKSCLDELEELDELQASYKKDQLTIISIPQDSNNLDNIKTILSSKNIKNLKIYTYEGNDLFKNLNITSIPASLVLNRENQVILKITGWNNKSVDLIKSLL